MEPRESGIEVTVLCGMPNPTLFLQQKCRSGALGSVSWPRLRELTFFGFPTEIPCPSLRHSLISQTCSPVLPLYIIHSFALNAKQTGKGHLSGYFHPTTVQNRLDVIMDCFLYSEAQYWHRRAHSHQYQQQQFGRIKARATPETLEDIPVIGLASPS
ncbi:hypothetical protein C8J56DRAFT_63680 [Mycena floridula]|nr:hypothetical protein C8J56DRAFT_63680 [Mycena floridula]